MQVFYLKGISLFCIVVSVTKHIKKHVSLILFLGFQYESNSIYFGI